MFFSKWKSEPTSKDMFEDWFTEQSYDVYDFGTIGQFNTFKYQTKEAWEAGWEARYSSLTTKDI